MIFRNRTQAGRLLAEALRRYRDQTCVVLALPRGGVPVAAEVARGLGAPLDLVIVRKIGVPAQPELAMGAVVDTEPPFTLVNNDVLVAAGISSGEFAAIRDEELREARRRRATYLADRSSVPLKDATAILVDDGIATGASIRAALKAVDGAGAKRIVVAAPVAPRHVVVELRRQVDDVVCLETPPTMGAIGRFYEDFDQVSDNDVIALLRHDAAAGDARTRRTPHSPPENAAGNGTRSG
jgi:predicted phosphoribosyltransferase